MTSTNDGKDVKSNHTSGPKGKSYYIELYKFLESRLSEGGDAHDRTKHLCVAWRSVHSLCQHSAPSTHTHLLNWLQRHTARAVLQTEWQTPKRKDDRKSLEEAIDAFIAQVSAACRDGGSLPWEAQLVARGQWFKRVLDKPWDHPVLTLLLNPNGTPPTDDEVLAWLKEERGVTFVMRLHTLVGEKCDDIAVSLASAVMERARAALPPVADSEEQTEAPPVVNATPTFADELKGGAGFTPDVWETLMDIEFVLLHKRDSKRCIALAKQTPLLDAYPLIERLQKRLEAFPREKRLWKNAREVAILIAQVVIARCMVVKSCLGAARTALYCCARLLARLLVARLPAAADALAAQALTARHLHTLAQAVDKQLSPSNEEMKPYVCELYVRAITAGMNELERLKLKTEKETEARSMEKSLASWFVQLGAVLARSGRIACECALTAFSLHPSQKMYERIDAAPPLAPVTTDSHESKEETVKSEFGSWANDSRSQTNLVKTSETLNMKHTQNQANVLSTAIFNEGEALGLSPELCQDIAVLLSGPRVKTLSWDMDRTLLLENCRAYCEMTHEGTRVLTRELKYLNIDPQQYQHLPEEKDDDENDPYYGIERGYEHLAVLEEPEEIWEDANDPEKTESSSSIEQYYMTPRRKKKTKRQPLSSDEDSDPLSFMAEANKTQKKKERPLSKERSKPRKKKQDLVDPLDINAPNQNEGQTKPKKEPKVKKERKKKEKVPKVIGGKLARLVGIKVKPKKKSRDITSITAPVTNSDNNSQGTNSLNSVNSESLDPNSIKDKSISRPKPNSQEKKIYSGMMKNQSRVAYNMVGNRCVPLHLERQNNLTKMQYRPQTPNTVRQPSPSPSDYNRTMINNFQKYPEDVRANLSKLLEYRRLQDQQRKLKQQNIVTHTPPRNPAIIRQDIQLQSNINPKSVAIPEIPKSFINKEQAEQLAEFMRVQNKVNAKESVIQFAKKGDVNKNSTASSSIDYRRAQHSNANSMKMTDFVNPSYDRLMAEIAERHRGQEVIKPAHSQYQPVHSQGPVQYSQRPVQRSLNVETPGQRDFQNFIKEYDHSKNTTQAIDMSAKSTREVKKPVMPLTRVIPVVPKVPKPGPNLLHCRKQPVQKKPEPSLNTFSRLNYHKTKQNEMKNKIQAPKLSTYQEVSSELDEIIKEHQRAQMKVIQNKRENDRVIKPVNVPELVNKRDTTVLGHPLLTNLLQSSPSNPSFCRNESSFKSNPVQQTPPAPPNTSLLEKDNMDLINLLRQQNKLNNSHYYSTNVISKPSTSTISKAPPVTSYNPQQQPIKPPTQGAKKFASTLETKIINVISNTLLKPGHHEINKSISVNVKPQSNSPMLKPVNCTVTHDVVKKHVASNDQKKPIPESSKPEWQAVMSDLLRHKTPTRGPNALDVALNKSSFELAFEKSLKEASKYSQNHPATEEDMVPIKHHEEVQRPKPVIGSIQNVIITKKGIKLQNEVVKQQKDASAVSKACLKQPVITMNEKLKSQNLFEPTKKLPQEVQRKQFTYTGPKHVDPFISGIPNSDYDLLEELMDDDLRKEIGELSSDDESYNTAAQSFLKPTKNQASSDKRVSVQFNKCLNEPATKPAANVLCGNDRQSKNELLLSGTPKLVSQCSYKIGKTPHESNSLKVQQKASNKTQLSNCVTASTSHSALKHIPSMCNAQNLTYSNVKALTNDQMMFKPNIYISAVSQPTPVHNVVLVGQELVYGGYANIQTPVQSVNNLASNAYIAVNSTPMTLYQTMQYVAPLAVGTPITEPAMNDVSCTAMPVQPNVVANVTQSYYPTTTVEPQPTVAEPQTSIKTETYTELKSQDRAPDSSQPNYKLQEEHKVTERKVLSEVQDFVTIEKIDKKLNQETVTSISVNLKNETDSDVERLKNKRLAIINREIYHRCEEKIIPLTYSPLSVKIETVLQKHDFSKAIPLSYTSLSSVEDKQKLSDSEEEKLLAQIKNNLQDLSDAINEVQSPATPDSNDSKENKSYSAVPCRRILLRSSNKITSKSNAERVVSATPMPKKSKAKLKSEVPDATKVCNKTIQDKIDGKETNAPNRASKRLRNKKSTITTEKKKPLDVQLQKPANKVKLSSTNKVKSKLQKYIETESLEGLDIESELQGSNISKIVKENKNKLENDRSKSENCEGAVITADKGNENIIPETGTVITADKTNENIISETGTVLIADKSNENIIPEKGTGITGDKTNENIIPETNISRPLPQNIIPESGTVEIADKTNKNIIPGTGTVTTADKTNENIISETGTVLTADKTNENIIPERGTGITGDKTNENIIPETNISRPLPQKTTVADEETEDSTPEGPIDQKTSLSEQSLLAAAADADEEKKDAISEVSITQTEKFSQKITKPATEEIISVAIPQKTSGSRQLSQNAVDGQHISKPIKDLKVDDKSALEHKSNCVEIEQNLTSDYSKLLLNAKNSTEVPVSLTEALIKNSDDKQSAKNCDTKENKTINNENKGDLPGKDNIDLDMTVTCEEVPIPKPSPTFGNIKTARNKPINADKKKDVNICDDVKLSDDTEKNTKEKETPFAVSHDIEVSEKTQPCIEVVNVHPTPGAWLVNKMPKSMAEPEVASSGVLNTTNKAADIDDDVVIIDDDSNTESTASLKERVNESSGNKIDNIEASVVNSVTTRSNAKMPVVKPSKDKAPVLNAITCISHIKTHTDTNTTVDSNLADVAELSEIPQSFKDNIRIEHLPSNDPMKTCVRISLPNGRKVIATVRDKVHVTYDTLFAHPDIKEALLNQKMFKKRYVMNVQQILTVDKSDPNKILSVQINKIETETSTDVPVNPVETIDLLSDDENSAPPKIIDTNKQVFVTEYGKFTGPSIDKDLFIKHQNKFSQKSRILLKKVDEKSETQVEKVEAKTNIQIKKTDPKPDSQLKKKDAKHSPSKTIASSPLTPIIPSQYVTGLLNDIENKLASVASNTPTVIPEVVEIDDSSNDSLCQSKSAETVTNNKALVDLKNVLLKELGVEVETQASAKSLQEESINDDDVVIVETIQPPKKRNRRKVLNLSDTPGKSYPFNDLNEEDQQHISKRKCVIELVRCDDLAKKYKQNGAGAKTQSAAHIVDDEPIIITGYTMINDLNEKIVETEERSSSPVIELFDVLVSLDDKSPAHSSAVHQVTPLYCAANWLRTKCLLHLQSMNETAIVRSNVFENVIMSNDSVTDQAIPLSCEANWLTTKFSLHLQGANDAGFVRSHVEYDDEMRDDRSDDQAISLSCEANWLTTKPILHLQAIDDMVFAQSGNLKDDDICDDSVMNDAIPRSYIANWDTTKPTLHLLNIKEASLVQSHVEYDDEMCDDRMIGPSIPLPCEANWLMTKHALYLQGINNTKLVRSIAFEYDKMCDDNLVQKEIPLSCEANWLTTKSTLHLQSDNYEFARSNVIELENISNGMLAHNVTSLACEAQWFTSKAALHLEAARDVLFMRFNVSNDEGNETEEHYYRSSTPDVVNETDIMAQTAPSLASLVLEGLRNTNIIHQYTLLRKASTRSPINLLKRKSTSLKNSAACKVSKVNVTSDCPVATPLNVGNISGDILQATKRFSQVESSSENKTLICATKCDDNHNLSLSDDGEEQISEASDCSNEEKAVTLDSNTNIDCVLMNDALPKSSDFINDENAFSSNENRSPSPVIDTSIILAFENDNSTQYYKNCSSPTNESQPLSPTITTEQTSSTENYSLDNVSKPGLETENNINEKHTNDVDDKDTIHTSAEANKSTDNSLDDESSTVRNTSEIEAKPNEDSSSGDFDDIEVKLSEIVGEPLIDATRITNSQNNKMTKISDSKKSEIIRIILEDNIINTDGNEIEISVGNVEDTSFFKDSDIPVDEYSEAKGHEYYTSLGASSVLDSIDEVICISTDDVMFLLKNESTKNLNREINDMCSDEIVDNIVDHSTANMNSDESDSRKFSDQLSCSVNLENNVSTTTDENCKSQITIKDHDDNASHKEEENKCREATEHTAEDCVTTKLLNDVCAESIMSKYLALIRNKSKVLESIVEYEDPEAGICYVIPIIEESSHSDIELVENTEADTSMTESPKISTTRQNNTSPSKDICKQTGLDHEDTEVRLAEIIGESFEENKNTTSTRVMRLDDKYKTSYSVEVEAITIPEQDAENMSCQLKETVDHESPTLVKSLKAKSASRASKKRKSKYHHKSKYVSSVTDAENLKVKMPKHTYPKPADKIRTCRRSSKRKMDMSDTKTSERKYRKSKNIDYPKFTVPALSETVYAKEYKNLLDYCSSVKFSFSVPFHKENIDVHDMLKSWPINDTHPQTTEQSLEVNESLFADIEKSETLDPLEQTLPEEIISKFDENSYIPSNIPETNFNMGFGERSGRVIQESKDGEFTTFSAATLSDVKQLQPLLPSDETATLVPTNCVDDKVHDQKLKAMRFFDNLNLKNKVRSFFEKTKAELDMDLKVSHKKDHHDNNIWPFGDLTSTRYIRPSHVEVIANVVQVGQLPVSAAAQNPVTCDPRVTHVSNASPSQCSPGNSLGDELQTPIKTEYTELTTADITLPLMQEYVQHHSMPSESQEPTNLYGANDSSSMSTQMSVVKIELMDESSQDNNVDYENDSLQQLSNGSVSNSVQYQFENIAKNVVTESNLITATNSSKTLKTTATFSENKQSNNTVEKPDQLAHAMNAAGISATKGLPKSNNCVSTMQQSSQANVVTQSQANANNFSKGNPINAIALQQALAQILPPPLNQTNTSESNPQTCTNPQVLHIVQGNNSQSVINKTNGTQLLHIVQNKSAANTNGTPVSQQNTFSGLSLVDGAIQQSGNQLLHIVNTANQKNTNAGQLLKRVNLLTNLANVQGSNEQKMVQFVCKSADGKSIQLPHQRSMVLRFQPLDPSNVPSTPKQNENQDHSSTSGPTHPANEKESSPQEMKSRSLYEENYAKFVQNDPKFAQNGDSKLGPEKATSLPKFNQVFGKQVYQEKQSEMDSENLPENSEPPADNNSSIEQMNDITNPSMLIRKTNPAQPSHVQPNLVQQIKQTIGPMNIQTMHGGVIYTRQIPVNIGNGQTINLITVPSTELVDDSAQKQQTDAKFANQDGDPPIIKIVPTNQPATTPNGSTDDNNGPIRSTNDANPQPNTQPQPVLTQMRIKLPMLSKAPQMVGGTRVVRPSFFQIQRNVIGGANQQVYQQLVLTAAPPMGQSIRLPAQMQKPKTPSETQSSPESQMSSSTLEQLREFDMVLEQVKERSTVQPGSSTSSTNNFTKLKSSPDTTDSPTPSTSTQESPTQVYYTVGNTQPFNMVNVNRKSTITSTTTTSFVRSPDSTGTVESPPSSSQSHLPHTVTSDSCASSSCASEAAAATVAQPKPKKKKPKPSTSNSNPFNIKNTPKPSSQKPLEDEQTTQRILYILAEYKEQVENSPDKDKPAPRRRNNPAAPNAGSSKRKKSSSGSRRRDMSPVLGEDSCRTMGSEDSSCGTSLGECNECLETHSPEESPKKVVRRLTFEQETQITQTRTTTTTTTIPQRNVIVTDGQAFAVRGPTGKPATTVLMPANYLLPVSMVKGGQQIAIVTNRGPKLLVGAGDGGSGGTLLFQRLIGPGGLKPVLARPGVRHIRLPTAALHNLQAFNIATPTAVNIQPPDSTASPAPAPAPPDLVDTRAMSSPWPDRDAGEVKPERGNSSPEGSEPWNLPSSSIADDYGYEEIVRTDNMDRTVLDAIPDRYSPDLEAQRIFDKMFDSDSKKSMYDSRCGYDIDASDDDKAYHQVVHRKDGRHTRLTHVSAAALRHKYAILEHELRLQKSLSEECEDLGVDSPSASELFPEAELLFAPSPAHEQTIDQCHTPQPTIHTQGIPQPDLDDQIATDHLLTHKERHDDLDINLDDVGEIVTVGEDGMTTIPLDHEEFARSHEEFARSHPNTTFHSEPEDGEVPPFTIAQSIKGRQITFHSRGVPGTVVMAPQTTVISQATIEASGSQNPVKFSDIDNMINSMPTPQHAHINMPSVLKESNESLTKFDRLLNESRELNLSNTASAIVHSTGNGTQVIRRVQYERRDSRYLVEDDAMIAGDSKADERRDMMDDTSSSERHPELFWDTQPRPERKRFDFSSDSDKCCKSPYDETNSDSSGIGAHMRLDSVIKAARTERRRSEGSSAEESHPPLRTYPPKRTYQHTHHSHHHDVDRSVTGKTRASDRCHDVKDESRRRASNRGVVKRGCQCCNGSTPPKPKKSRPKKTSDYPQN